LLGLVGPTGGGQVITQIESMLNDVVRAELDGLVDVDAVPRAPLDLVASSVVGSFLATLKWWVDTDFARTPGI
jgi:hypothetical protein